MEIFPHKHETSLSCDHRLPLPMMLDTGRHREAHSSGPVRTSLPVLRVSAAGGDGQHLLQEGSQDTHVDLPPGCFRQLNPST